MTMATADQLPLPIAAAATSAWAFALASLMRPQLGGGVGECNRRVCCRHRMRQIPDLWLPKTPSALL